MSTAQRSIASVSWNAVANAGSIVVGVGRSVLLARLLPVEAFGVYSYAGSIVNLSGIIPYFGMRGAFLHRAPETEDEEQAAAVHFTLKLLFTLAWASALTILALCFSEGENRTALLWLTTTHAGIHLTQTPHLILTRRIVHRRLALLSMLNAVLTAVVAVGLAWQGVGLWALLATDIATLILNVSLLYVWRPVWRPRLEWTPKVVRYFLSYGSRGLPATLLLRALDRVDDLWCGAYLGRSQLGYYSRAYRFATYPRTIVASPINAVAAGTYAELKGDRRRLSQAFFRSNALLIRSGFLLAGLLALAAPEFIRLVLGAKWIPMLRAFRLMLVFTLFDPIKLAVGDLFLAVGRPEVVVRARATQLTVLLVSLFLLGPALGIAGVALAADAMLVVGIGLLLWQARAYVDFSLLRLVGVPFVGLFLGLALGRLAILLPGALQSDWHSMGVKTTIFALAYGSTLLLLERDSRRLLARLSRYVWQHYVQRTSDRQGDQAVLDPSKSVHNENGRSPW